MSVTLAVWGLGQNGGVWYLRSLPLVTGPSGKGTGVAEVVKGEMTSEAYFGLSHAQDYPITDVCQILQKAKELQDSK